ncbi:LOW QUALITY PROTEIN: platelet glycoprotein V-like [Palaemon carinicauda]|uniref:LOW QUALITY PROTEIN: platelet glycoprotein V-like n=1 Tax=Palaemon carinicauda TaxID=392227 RepID=UPI0035B578D6
MNVNVFLSSFQMLILLMVLWTLLEGVLTCPRECRCSLDERGRQSVRCEEGGMSDPLPVMDMGEETEVLVISAPHYNPNTLTLGPIFKGLRQLEEIHITRSKIPALGAHSFWGLHKLHVLNLTRNHISALMDTNFRGADALRHLDLSLNRIQSAPSAVFRHVRHIRTLSLANNMVPELMPRVFFGLARLERLDLSFNPLRDLQPERFTDVPDLKQLYCSGCGLMLISSSLLQTLPELRELDLSKNRLTQVPPGIASNFLPHLIHLRLGGNHISFIERGAISGSPITHLHLSHNRISRLEVGSFFNSSLKHLDLAYNRLAHLENNALDDVLDDLHEINLSGNSLHVDQLLSILPKARQISHLGLGDMGLTRLPPELLRHSRHLRHLNISANYLTSLSTDVLHNAPHLYSLDLSMNAIWGLDSMLVAAINAASELRTLRLEGNPWQCDTCHILPLLRWLQDTPDQESGCSEPRVWTCLKCVGPKGVSGLELALLPHGDLPECPYTTPPAAAIWTTWVEPSLNAITEEPQLPRGQLTRSEDADIGWTLERMVKEELHLVIVAACALVLLLLALIIAGIVLYSGHSAFYYTYENDPEKKEKLMKFKDSKTNNSPASKTPLKKKTDATITTIDELTDIAGSQGVIEDDQKLNNIPNQNSVLNSTNSVNHSPYPNHISALNTPPDVSRVSPSNNGFHPLNHIPSGNSNQDQCVPQENQTDSAAL